MEEAYRLQGGLDIGAAPQLYEPHLNQPALFLCSRNLYPKSQIILFKHCLFIQHLIRYQTTWPGFVQASDLYIFLIVV